MRGVIDSQATSGSSRIKTALTDNELESFGTPDPRILVCGCGGSGNNTMNRITHIGVEGAITVAINTDKQDLDLTRAMQKLLVGRHIAPQINPFSTVNRATELDSNSVTR